MKSIKYYDTYSDEFIKNSIDANMEMLQTKFETFIPPYGRILDLGCGSGRDSAHFHNKGYNVTSMDGSIQMFNYCNATLNNHVVHSTFENFETRFKFDGIWACASLLHVDRKKLNDIIGKYINFLNINGVFFMSFKNRVNDFEKDGRFFTCFNKESLNTLLLQYENIEILDFIETADVRDNRDDELWVSVIIKRTN